MATLDWKGSELKLGPFTVAKVEPEGWCWKAAGTKALGPMLRERWQERDDAQQDVESGVRSILKAHGVDHGC